MIGVLAAALGILVLVLGTRLVRSWRGTRRSRADGGYVPGTDTDAETDTQKPTNLLRWFTTVDHKDIGVLYVIFGTIAGVWGGIDAMMMRTELLTAQTDVWSETTYNALFTTHGLTMLFFFVTPVFFGLGNYFLPLLIGADDMAFPRINAIAFWLLPSSLVLVRAGLITDVLGRVLGLVGAADVQETLLAIQPPATGWTLYPPLSATLGNPQVDIMLLGLHLSGLATIMAAINFIVTTFAERGEDTDWATLDILSWTLLTTAGIVLFAFPMLGSAIVMLLLDRNFGTTFFAVEAGGPILWQHLFWFFGHPEVYILVLPAFGLISLILPKFSGRKLFGFRYIVYSTLAIGVLSFGVWAHHMFSTGIDPRIRASFMAVSLAIAIPSAIKTFNWITTMWEGKIRLSAPMVFCIGSVGTFVIGGVTGVFLAAIPIDLLYHDTYYVVGHFHFIVMGVIAFAAFAASYYWYPILAGRMYDQRLAKLHAWLTIAGVFITFGLLLVIGALGLPRRYASYPELFAPFQQVASVGAYIIGTAQLLWVWNMVRSYFSGPIVREADVWNLKESGQFTNEWVWFEGQLADRFGTSVEDAETNPPSARSDTD